MKNPKKIYAYCKANLTYGEAIEMINVAITKLGFQRANSDSFGNER